jgi:Arc/MetJ-type ribon-helix-helix transcriptional regulator
MKLSVSLPVEDVEFLDRFARTHGRLTRSAAVHEAVRALRDNDLGPAYEQAWRDFEETGELAAWERSSGDGVEPGTGGSRAAR